MMLKVIIKQTRPEANLLSDANITAAFVTRRLKAAFLVWSCVFFVPLLPPPLRPPAVILIGSTSCFLPSMDTLINSLPFSHVSFLFFCADQKKPLH